ncbi:MAG: ATPase, T2SS/T4P/T4SS family [Candidatus Aenigmarchaeota archaeon]|nr:ATPase, T2SS/T4P/T4SS family [Candidatus Aenigmarchaeota archaeon]MDI6721988.1 ATPase, T2SS/T4P/T4SS family [Candidatus Aenigmarchaeota archaeon]
MEEENINTNIDQQKNNQNETKEPAEIFKEGAEKSLQNLAHDSFISQKTEPRSLTPKEWFEKVGWNGNPFTFTILPELFVGYSDQTSRLLSAVEEKHKIILVVGPTGSGKTTTLKWMALRLPANYDYVYIGKPPKHADDFVQIFNEKYTSWFIFSRIKNVYQLPSFLNRRIGKKHLVVMYDEAQESSIDILEWMRVLGDQVSNMSIVISGLPSFESQLDNLETLRRRIAAKISLLSLTKEETKNLIRKRIQNVGGSGSEFSEDAMDYVYQKTGGFPREILRLCDDMIHQAMNSEKFVITAEYAEKESVQEAPPPLRFMEEMTPMKKELMEMLISPMTPGQIADTLDLQKYKSRQHAVRSVNNILKRLMDDGAVERKRLDKAFVYQLKPHIKNLVVKS